jgi:hypothetical protein
MTAEEHTPQATPAAPGGKPERTPLASEVSRLEAEVGPHAHHPPLRHEARLQAIESTLKFP